MRWLLCWWWNHHRWAVVARAPRAGSALVKPWAMEYRRCLRCGARDERFTTEYEPTWEADGVLPADAERVGEVDDAV